MPEDEAKYTDALWTAIALVGHSKWVQYGRVAPDTGPWTQWVEEPGNIAAAWQVNDKLLQDQVNKTRHETQEALTTVIDTTKAQRQDMISPHCMLVRETQCV